MRQAVAVTDYDGKWVILDLKMVDPIETCGKTSDNQ